MLTFVLTNLAYTISATTLVIIFLGIITYVFTAIKEKDWFPKNLDLDTFWGVLIGLYVTAALVTIFVSIPTWRGQEHDRNLVQACNQVAVSGENIALPTGEEIQIGITTKLLSTDVIIYNDGVPVGEFEDNTGNIWYVDQAVQRDDPFYYICVR